MSLIVTRKGYPTRRLQPSSIPNEEYLQEFILLHPESLPLGDLRDELQLAIVAREFPTTSGPIDAVALDDQGEVYLIETKLYKNPDKRRVVAQVLDYGAALWQHSGEPSAFLDELSKTALRTLRENLESYLSRVFGQDSSEVDELLEKAGRQVTDGTFRFLVLMDRLDEPLRDLIRYLNENSRFDIFSIELQFYQFDGYELVIPKLHGSEVRKEAARSRSAIAWDEARFFAEVDRTLSPGQVRALRQLYTFVVAHADRVTWGRGTTIGSFCLKDQSIHPTKSLLCVYTPGYIEVNFAWLHEVDKPLPTSAQRFAESLEALRGWSLPANYPGTFVRIHPEIWVPQVDTLVAAIRTALAPNLEV